jgi:hypothetical protein
VKKVLPVKISAALAWRIRIKGTREAIAMRARINQMAEDELRNPCAMLVSEAS